MAMNIEKSGRGFPSSAEDQRAYMVNSFLTSVYSWMCAGLLVTAICGYAASQSEAFLEMLFSGWLYLGLVACELGLVWFLSSRISGMSPQMATLGFLAFAGINGLTIATIFKFYTQSSIIGAFLGASGLFAALSLYGAVTKRNLASLGGFLFAGLICIVIASLINIFVGSSTLQTVVCILGIFIFMGLTAFDTQKIAQLAGSKGDDARRYAIVGALSLYLDFINMFLMLLQLFGRRD